MKRINLLLKILAIWTLFIFPIVLEGNSNNEKHIVVIHSFYSELTVSKEIDRSIEDYTRNKSMENIHIHTLYLDAANYFSLSPTRIARRTLRKLELFDQIDGFIIIGKPAFYTMIKDEFTKFSHLPTIFLSNADLVLNVSHSFTNYLCINEDINVAPSLDLALNLFPTAKKVVIIANDSSPVVEHIHKLIHKNLHYFTAMSVNFIPDMNLTEYGEFIQSIKEETIILLSDYVFSDEPHRVNDNDLAYYLTKNPNLRIFTTHKHFIKHNIIGGFVVDYQQIGNFAITSLFDLINHRKSIAYNEVIYIPNSYYFNRKALQDFNIDLKQLPPNYHFTQQIKNKKIKSIYYLYALLILLFIIGYLLFILSHKTTQNKRHFKDLLFMQKLLSTILKEFNLQYWYKPSGNKTIVKSHNFDRFIPYKELQTTYIHQKDNIDTIITNKKNSRDIRTYRYISKTSPDYSFGLLSDLSEKIHLEANFDKTNQLNRLLLKSINEAVISLSAQWEIEWYNQATIDLYQQVANFASITLKLDEFINNVILKTIKLDNNIEQLKEDKSIIIQLDGLPQDFNCKLVSLSHTKDGHQSQILIISEQVKSNVVNDKTVISDKLLDFFSSIPYYSAWSYQKTTKFITFSKNFGSIIDERITNYSFPISLVLKHIELTENKDTLANLKSFIKEDSKLLSVDLVFITINGEKKWVKLKGEIITQSDPHASVSAIGFIKDITPEMRLSKENSDLKQKIEQQKKIHNKKLFSLKQEILTKKKQLDAKIKKLSSEKSYIEAHLDLLVQQNKMNEIETFVRGISNEFNEPLTVLKLSNEVFINEIELMLEYLNTIVPLLNDEEMLLLSSVSYKIINQTMQSNLANKERTTEVIPSLKNIEEIEFATISKVSKLIVSIGLQANLKAIKPLISHPQNETILSFLMTIKNLVNLKHNINFDLDNLTRIAYSLRRYVETSNPKAMGSCDLIQIIHKSLSYFKYQLDNNIDLELSLPEQVNIKCNPDDFIILLSNIIQNSIDAIDEDEEGKIEISVSNFNDKLLLKISDNGIGIDEKAKQHLFEPFYTTKEAGKGIGLGLVIAKHITDNHNATLEIDSNQKGTSVSIYINKER